MTDEAKDEKDMSPDERMEWLRNRGIEIVTPPERKLGSVAAAMRDADQLSDSSLIHYVYVPSDTSKPIEERSFSTSLATSSAKDPLLEHVKPLFATGSDRVDVTLLEQQGSPANLLASSSSGAAMPHVSHETLQQVAKEGHVETFTLVHPTPSNNMTSVLVYLDEVGMLKRLPLNKRATEFATRAGYNPPPQFYGDVVLGRMHYVRNGGGRKQPVDLKLADARLDAEWLLHAVMQNIEHQQQFNEATGTKQEQPAVKGTDGAAAVERDYIWTQSEEELEVRVALNAAASPISKKDVQIRFAPQTLQVFKPKTVHIALFERVDVDSCTWTIEKNEIVISMEKQEAALWPRIVD
ncbi:hypothetical protein MPSEU_000977800 [Mayamaea pseudoterrestris]|nr:hypothetical protein MPSEU_000977800 [Mayamaea pseudoterrestris]